jgi:hypothetical protein
MTKEGVMAASLIDEAAHENAQRQSRQLSLSR